MIKSEEDYEQGYRHGIETAERIVKNNKKKVKNSEDLNIEEGIDYSHYIKRKPPPLVGGVFT